MVEDACLWNKYIRNTRVRIPLATPFLRSVMELVYVSHSKCGLSGFESQLAESGVNELVELPDSESGFNGGSSPSARVL